MTDQHLNPFHKFQISSLFMLFLCIIYASLYCTACGDYEPHEGEEYALTQMIESLQNRCALSQPVTEQGCQPNSLEQFDHSDFYSLSPLPIISLTSMLKAPSRSGTWTWVVHSEKQELLRVTDNHLDLSALAPMINKPTKLIISVTQQATIDDLDRCESEESFSQMVMITNELSSVATQRLLAETQLILEPKNITSWGFEVVNYEPGESVEQGFMQLDAALGEPSFNREGKAMTSLPFDQTLSLGEGGEVTIRLQTPIGDGDGPDLVVFENSFNGSFVEYAFVEVSSDGEHFARFPSLHLNNQQVGSFDEIEGVQSWGLAGLGTAGEGVSYDLAYLQFHHAVLEGAVRLDHIEYIKIVDIKGDGSQFDSLGIPIYDPYPTVGSSGFDLDAIGGRRLVNQECTKPIHLVHSTDM